MVSLLGAVQRLAAEISIRDATSEGAASAAASFRKIGEAAEGSARVVETSAKVSASAERAYQRLERVLDPLSAANARLARDQKTLERAFETGLIGADRYRQRLDQLADQFQRTKTRIEATERAQGGLNRAVEGFGPALNIARGAVAGFFAAFSFGAIVRGAKDAVAALAEIADKAKSLGGIDQAGFLQEARFALGQQGFGREEADNALTVFTRNLGALDLNTGPLDKVLDRLEGGKGVAAQLKAAQDLRQQYEIILGTLEKMDDAGQRMLLATAAFGKEAGAKFGAAITGGVEELQKLQQEARDSGLVIEESLIARADALDDRLRKASDVIETQMKRAFLSLGPILSDLAEMIAALIKGLVDQLNDLPNRVTRLNALLSSPDRLQRLKDLPALEESRGAVEFDKQRAQTALDRLRTERSSATGLRIGAVDSFFENSFIKTIAAADEKLVVINRRMTELQALNEAAGTSAAGIGKGYAEAGEEAILALDAIRKATAERDRALRELAAAQGGRAALDAFRRGETIEKAVDAAGLVGTEARAAMKALLQETVAATEKTKALERAFNGVETAAKKAAAVRFDPLADVRADNARLQTLIEASVLGTEELDKARERMTLEDQIARVKVEATRLNRDLSEEEVEAIRKQFEERVLLTRELSEREDAAQAAKAAADAWDRELRGVADRFFDHFVETGKLSFRGLAGDLKSLLLNAVLSPFRQALGNLLSGVFGGIGGGGGVTSAAGGSFLGIKLSPGVAAAGQGILTAVGAGVAGLGIGKGFSDLLGLDRRTPARGAVTGLVGGAAGGVIAGTAAVAAGTSLGLGATLGLGAAIGGPIGAAIGVVIGLGLALLKGKPSNKVGQLVFDPLTGSLLGEATKDQSRKSLENLDLARSIQQGVFESVAAITRLTGGDLGGFLLNVEAGTRGIRIGQQGADGNILSPQKFETTEEGATAAVMAGLELAIDRLQNGDRLLTEIAKGFVAAGKPIDDVVSRLTALKNVLAEPNEFVDPLEARIDAVIDAFSGLDRSSGALKDAFDKAVDQLAKSVDQEARRALAEQDNPRLVAIEDLLKQQAARRAEIERLASQGGAVDASLIAEFQRRQLLNQFNAGDRFSQATDPSRFGIDKLVADQAAERTAFRRAVEGSGGLLTEADFLTLVRAQEAERFQAFKALPDEEKLRLAGRTDFDDLTRQYALAVERLISETEKLRQSFEAERARLSEVVTTRAGEVETFAEAIRQLDQRAGAGTPGQSVDRLRAQLEDLGNRALSPDEATKTAARAQLPDAVNAYVDALERVFASGDATANGVAFARDLLARVQARAGEEQTLAQKQLDQLELMRERLDVIAELMAAPRLDVTALVKATAGLDPQNPVTLLALQLADLEARQTAQNDRLIAALEALTPADVGLASPAPETGVAPFAAPAVADNGLAPSPRDQTTATNSPAPDSNSDVARGLLAVAAAVDEQTATIFDFETAQRQRDERMESYLKQIATRRASEV